ncbi:HPP family protein [Haloarcula sebkhae]|uniref:HPP family protein n=3 Tax=Haloarcula TaxID=2237 RepID=A0ACC6VRT9_9EURY
MPQPLRRRILNAKREFHRRKRTRVRALRRWLEDTENLLHICVLVIVPLLIAAVTWLSNMSPVVSFLVYPPLASGTYTLFADPHGRYSDARRFVGGMTVGAVSGWLALELTAQFWYTVPPTQFQVHSGAAALGIFLTGALTWLLDLEVPTAYSSALLVLVTGSEQLRYVAGISVASAIIAGLFIFWRREFYRERAQYLFQSTSGNDQILVPIGGENATSLALFAGQIAAAHDAGKVVLMDSVTTETIDQLEADLATSESETEPTEKRDRLAEDMITEQSLSRLERIQESLTSAVDISCEFVVAVESDGPGETVLRTAADENCDLVVAPYEVNEARPTKYVRQILGGPTDVIAFRSATGMTEWRHVLVMVRAAGPVANAMLEFTQRLCPTYGTISVCTCIEKRASRRNAEIMLENLEQPFDRPVETRVAHDSVEHFLERNATNYDLVVLGASTDRSTFSRLLSEPTHESLRDLDCDLAVVHQS